MLDREGQVIGYVDVNDGVPHKPGTDGLILEIAASYEDCRVLLDALDILHGMEAAGLLTSGNVATVRELTELVHGVVRMRAEGE